MDNESPWKLARDQHTSAHPTCKLLNHYISSLADELRASQAECERLRERGAEWRKERDEAVRKAAEDEREICANLADEAHHIGGSPGALATRIRARAKGGA